MRLIPLIALALVAADWPQWRGPTANGAASGEPPLRWSATENVRWAVTLPGVGNSSPVVFGDRILLTASSGRADDQLHLLCYRRGDGRLLWNTRLTASPALPPFRLFPPLRGHAASTPATDGKYLVALFGTGDLACLDLDGRPRWFRSLGRDDRPFRNDYGIAASPIIIDDMVMIQVDHADGSYLLAAELATGRTRWKTDRSAFDGWSTPVVASVGNERQLICLGTGTATGYDLASGRQTWTVTGLERLCATTPVVHEGRLYVVTGPGGSAMALDLTTSPPTTLWRGKRNGPFVPSPVVVNGLMIYADDQGFVTALDTATGTEKWRERLGAGRMRPSPVTAAGRVYFTALDGTTVVLRAAERFEVLARNSLGEEVAASAAVAGKELFFRTDRRLFRIATE